MATEQKKPNVGDWVRFQLGGVLVIGQVEYLKPRASWDSTAVYQTDIGVVDHDSILEIREKGSR